MADRTHTFRILAIICCVWTFVVITFGAYTRLSDAGLGCPDWPGCYGHLVGVPETASDIENANANFPEREVETAKAWKEMIHRYLAEGLGLFIIILAIMAYRNRHAMNQPVVIPILLIGLVIFQGLLGMWTVTLLLKPVIVMAHLLGGLTIFALLWWCSMASADKKLIASNVNYSFAITLGLVLLVIQIILGGWVSSNYAALACPDFPLCQGQLWPAMDFKEGFIFWRGLGIDYEFGVLDNPARTAIHMSHRLFAILVTVYWVVLLFRLFSGPLAKVAVVTLILLIIQIALGISNIVMHLPISVAVMHNGGAALLLLSVVTLLYNSTQLSKI